MNGLGKIYRGYLHGFVQLKLWHKYSTYRDVALAIVAQLQNNNFADLFGRIAWHKLSNNEF